MASTALSWLEALGATTSQASVPTTPPHSPTVAQAGVSSPAVAIASVPPHPSHPSPHHNYRNPQSPLRLVQALPPQSFTAVHVLVDGGPKNVCDNLRADLVLVHSDPVASGSQEYTAAVNADIAAAVRDSKATVRTRGSLRFSNEPLPTGNDSYFTKTHFASSVETDSHGNDILRVTVTFPQKLGIMPLDAKFKLVVAIPYNVPTLTVTSKSGSLHMHNFSATKVTADLGYGDFKLTGRYPFHCSSLAVKIRDVGAITMSTQVRATEFVSLATLTRGIITCSQPITATRYFTARMGHCLASREAFYPAKQESIGINLQGPIHADRITLESTVCGHIQAPILIHFSTCSLKTHTGSITATLLPGTTAPSAATLHAVVDKAGDVALSLLGFTGARFELADLRSVEVGRVDCAQVLPHIARTSLKTPLRGRVRGDGEDGASGIGEVEGGTATVTVRRVAGFDFIGSRRPMQVLFDDQVVVEDASGRGSVVVGEVHEGRDAFVSAFLVNAAAGDALVADADSVGSVSMGEALPRYETNDLGDLPGYDEVQISHAI
ncbi:hypothetical protein BC830DRAFT_1083928 [Chytriomyces sp. MP71]|nr:hypothetical protein BC830DRAFT_1083928 [Chytriomyces sp. MP71]